MANTYAKTVHIERPPAEVYSFLATAPNHTKIVPGLIEYDTDPPGSAWEVGTPTKGKRKALGRTITENGMLIEKVPNRRLVFDATVMGVTSRGTWEIEPAGEGSDVTLKGQMESSMLTRIMTALGVADPDEEISKVLAALKQELESR